MVCIMKMKHIPNILSVIRILLVFVFLAVFFIANNVYVAVFIFLLAGATDVVDGYLARRNNWVTNLGKILDPVADKLMQCTVLISFYIREIIPIWFVIPFFAKELITLIMGMLVIRKRSIVVVSKWYGKTAVCIFYATIVAAVCLKEILVEHLWLTILVFTPAVVFAIGALIAYVKHYAGLKYVPKAEKLDMNGDATSVAKE